MKLLAIGFVVFGAAAWAQSTSTSASPAATSVANPKARHLIGLEGVKGGTSGILTVEEGKMHFQASKAASDVPVSSIDDIFVGIETTQSGGKTGQMVKTAAIAAPFGSGKALTIVLRTKVDILTVAFHDTENAVHGAILALPKGQGEALRQRLIQAGAHSTPIEETKPEETKPEAAKP